MTALHEAPVDNPIDASVDPISHLSAADIENLGHYLAGL